MTNWKTLLAIILTVGFISFVGVEAYSKSAKTSTLTALDYAEIQQLNVHYAHSLDACVRKGEEWADLFTPDGEWISNGRKTDGIRLPNGLYIRAKGRDQLVAWAGSPEYCGPPKSALTVGHVIVNVMIEPTPEGAIGKSYILQMVTGKDGRTTQIKGAGKYYDSYVKTAAGWRFKTREFLQGQGAELMPEAELARHPL